MTTLITPWAHFTVAPDLDFFLILDLILVFKLYMFRLGSLNFSHGVFVLLSDISQIIESNAEKRFY